MGRQWLVGEIRGVVLTESTDVLLRTKENLQLATLIMHFLSGLSKNEKANNVFFKWYENVEKWFESHP